MSYAASAEDTFENVFEVIPTVGSNTEFFVKDFAVEDGTQWYATYDSAKSTLTMSGVQLGREDKGNLLGKFTKALTPAQSAVTVSSRSQPKRAKAAIRSY